MRGGIDELLRGQLPGLRQRPQRRRAGAGAAVAEDRACAPLERGLGILDHLAGDAVAAERNVVVFEAQRPGGSLDRRRVWLVRRFPVWPVVDLRGEPGGLDRGKIVRADLR